MTGQTIGHYRILEKLGSGGMGIVYKAEDTLDHRLVAVKFLSEEMAADPEALERFKREARAAAMLNHPNICKVLEVGEHEGRPFLVMPLVEGLNLKQRIALQPFSVEEMLRLASQMAEALDAAHARGIVHRDIKPGNIIITAAGEAIVLDFGLAKRVAARHGLETASGLSSGWGKTLTSTGMPMGTIEYMSPEQVRGEELDQRTDLFSLGLVYYEMATQRRAFEGPTPGVILEAILNRTPSLPSTLNPGLPAQFDAIIVKLLDKDREMRYQTALDLRADLRRLQRGGESTVISASSARLGLGRVSGGLASGVAARIAGKSPLVRGAMLAAAALALALSIGLLLRPPQAPALTDRDTVVLTDFINTTGEPVFDGALKQALAVQLGQSPYLNIFPERRVREALRLMGRSPDERVTREVAREICLREGIKAMIVGSISSLGQNYVLTLEAVDAQTGDSLASEQAESAVKEKVLQDLGRLVSRLRARLGESLGSIQKFDAPLERATTPSLEALRAFSLGNAERARGREFESIAFFNRALELDPNFALAHGRLAAIYSNLGEAAQAVEHGRKSYELRDRISERERYYITAHYFNSTTGEVEKVIENYEMWKRTFPRDPTPYTNLSAMFNDLGHFDRALAEAQAAEKFSGVNRTFATVNVAAAHLGSGRFKEAREVLDKMNAENPDNTGGHVLLFLLGCATRDEALKQQQLAWADGKESEATLHQLAAQSLASSGELAKSREVFHHTVELARRYKRRELEALVLARQAIVEAIYGNRREARAAAAQALRLAHGKEAKLTAALALARAGDLAGAAKAADDLAKQYPVDTYANAVSLPSIRAAIEIESGRPERAIEILRAAGPYELGFKAGLTPTFLRAFASMQSGDGVRAVAEFERIIARPGVEADSPLPPLAHCGLARAAALAGDKARSRAAYQEFLDLWKSSDPNLYFPTEARAELAREQARPTPLSP